MTRFKHLLGGVAAAALCAVVAPHANAVTLIAFGQSGTANTFTATENGANTATTLVINNAAVEVTALDAPAVVPFAAILNLNATSVGAASTVAGNISQVYSDTFSITSGPGAGGGAIGTGTNFLTATSFTDTISGAIGGPTLSLDVSDPPNLLTFTSSVIAASNLNIPRALSLSFTNLTPPVAVLGTSLASTSGNSSGNASGSVVVAAPEPASLALLGAALAGFGFFGVRRRRQS